MQRHLVRVLEAVMADITMNMLYEQLCEVKELLSKLLPSVEVVETPPELDPERMDREDRELIGLQASLPAHEYKLHYAKLMAGRMRAMGHVEQAERMLKRAESAHRRATR